MLERVRSLSLLRTAQALFYLNALIWLVFGAISLVRMANGDTNQTITLMIVAVLMFANAAAMMGSGLGLGTRRRIFYYLALGVLAANILLTFTDQFGTFDLLTLLIDLAIVAMLTADRQRYSW